MVRGMRKETVRDRTAGYLRRSAALLPAPLCSSVRRLDFSSAWPSILDRYLDIGPTSDRISDGAAPAEDHKDRSEFPWNFRHEPRLLNSGNISPKNLSPKNGKHF